MLEHLIDANPTSEELPEHLDLLQAARSRGAEAAYAAHASQRKDDRLVQILNDWVSTRGWNQSHAFADAHADDLLDPATAAILDMAAQQDLRDLTIRLHRGLLGCANAAGFGTAYGLRAAPEQLRATLAAPDLKLPAGTRLALARLHSGQCPDDPRAHFQLAVVTLLAGIVDEAAAAVADCADNAAPYERRDFALRLREAASSRPQLAIVIAELEQILTSAPGSADDISDATRAESGDTTADLVLAWINADSWEDSEAFLASHSPELFTLRGYEALTQLAADRPSSPAALHASLFRAAVTESISAAYAQLRAQIAEQRTAGMLGEWISLAADPAASAEYLAAHASDLHDPQAIALLAAECDRMPADPRLWQHLALLTLADQAADGYATMRTGDPNPFQRSADLLDRGDLDQALAWACLGRAAQPGPGALLIGQIQVRRGETGRARQALAAAAEQIDPGHLGEVLDAYELLIAADPASSWLHAEQAAALHRAGRTDDALAAYDQAVSLNPDDPSLHFNKASLLFGLSRFEDARPDLLAVTRLRPEDVLGAAIMLAALAWPADTGEAQQYLQAALASPGERLTPFTRAFYRAVALAGLGLTEDAISELEAASPARAENEMKLDPTDTALLNRFSDPPLPGLKQLLQFFQPPQGRDREQTEPPDPPS